MENFTQQQQQLVVTSADHLSVYSGIMVPHPPGSVILGGGGASQYGGSIGGNNNNELAWASGTARRPISQYGGSVVSMRPGSGNSQRSAAARPASIKSWKSSSSEKVGGNAAAVTTTNIQLPPDEVLLDELRAILAVSNLQNTTKRQLRDELSRRFGSIDLNMKRDWLNKKIDEMLGN